MLKRTIGFVWGYLPSIDVQSEVATNLRLEHRFTLAINRYPDSTPGLSEISFDADLVLGVLAELLPLFPHDTLTAVNDVGASHLDLATSCRTDLEDGARESFTSVTLSQDGIPTCYVEHEAYERCGGPHPYHDAYVYAFYSKGIERRLVQDALFSFCAANGVILSDVISGSPTPVRTPWYRRMLRV